MMGPSLTWAPLLARPLAWAPLVGAQAVALLRDTG